MNDSLFSSVSVDDELLKTRSDNFILLCEQENSRRMHSFCVAYTVELARDLRGNRSGEQPKIPPAVLVQNHLPQRGRIVQDQTGDWSLCRNVQGGRCANARSENHNWTLGCFASERIERSQRCRRDSLQTRGTGAATKSWIVYSPQFYCAFVPHFRFERNPSVRAIRISIEAQNINFRTTAFLCEPGFCRPTFKLPVFERDHSPSSALGLNRVRRRKENELVRQSGEHEDNNAHDCNRAHANDNSAHGTTTSLTSRRCFFSRSRLSASI